MKKFPISKAIQSIHSSPTFVIDSRVKELQKKGVKIYNLNLGEPDFPTPQNAKQAGIKAIRTNKTKYTDVRGTPKLLSAISKKMKRDNRLLYKPSEIIVSNGAKETLYLAIRTICEVGDEIIILAPYWVSYTEIVKLAGGKPIIVKTKDFRFARNAVEKAITKKTKAIIINSPNNPTGVAFSRKELTDLAQLVLKHKLLVVSDEIYEKFVYEGFRHISFASLNRNLKEYTLTINGVSKTYAMTGWRIGYCAGPRYIIEKMAALQSNLSSAPSSISQEAAIIALFGNQKSVRLMVHEFDKRRRLVYSSLVNSKIEFIKPEGAYYFFFKVKPRFDSMKFCQKMLDTYRVSLNPGESFGVPGWVRLSYTVPVNDLKEAMKRIVTMLKQK